MNYPTDIIFKALREEARNQRIRADYNANWAWLFAMTTLAMCVLFATALVTR